MVNVAQTIRRLRSPTKLTTMTKVLFTVDGTVSSVTPGDKATNKFFNGALSCFLAFFFATGEKKKQAIRKLEPTSRCRIWANPVPRTLSLYFIFPGPFPFVK